MLDEQSHVIEDIRFSTASFVSSLPHPSGYSLQKQKAVTLETKLASGPSTFVIDDQFGLTGGVWTFFPWTNHSLSAVLPLSPETFKGKGGHHTTGKLLVNTRLYLDLFMGYRSLSLCMPPQK